MFFNNCIYGTFFSISYRISCMDSRGDCCRRAAPNSEFIPRMVQETSPVSTKQWCLQAQKINAVFSTLLHWYVVYIHVYIRCIYTHIYLFSYLSYIYMCVCDFVIIDIYVI